MYAIIGIIIIIILYLALNIFVSYNGLNTFMFLIINGGVSICLLIEGTVNNNSILLLGIGLFMFEFIQLYYFHSCKAMFYKLIRGREQG